MSSNSVCNHTRENRTPAARSSDFVITRMITDRIGLHSVLLPLLITNTFIRIVTGKLRMIKITAVMAKAIFSIWYSCFQTISFIGHITTKNPALRSVAFMESFSKHGLRYLYHLYLQGYSQTNLIKQKKHFKRFRFK